MTFVQLFADVQLIFEKRHKSPSETCLKTTDNRVFKIPFASLKKEKSLC